jgi:hypothetical protein
MPRMTALKKIVDEDKVTTLVAICAICKSQFIKTLPYYGMQMYMMHSLHQLVSSALVMQRLTEPADDSESESSDD